MDEYIAPLTQQEKLDKHEDLKKTNNENTWEYNQQFIRFIIKNYLERYGNMPSKADIARETGFSRETIRKHLKSFADRPIAQSQIENFGVMTEAIMAQLLMAGLKGDLKAAKLYLDATRSMHELSGEKTTKNNYVQINNTLINQQIIQQLKPEQVQRIEEFISRELHEKKE